MIEAIAHLGSLFNGFVVHLGRITVFASEIFYSALRPPLRAQRIIDETYKQGVLSLIIISVCGLAVGMVLGLQGYNTLVRFGSEEALGAVVGLSLVRELGPVLTALLTTGRAGSATAAEIGAMVATQQLDGLRMMSVDPIDYVVRPKAIAMTAVMPMLCAIFVTSGLFGGFIVGVGLMGMDPGTFMGNLRDAVDFGDDVGGCLLKALLFGVMVGLIATYRGYTARPTAEGVSSATTSTVVFASVSILIADYFFTALWGV